MKFEPAAILYLMMKKKIGNELQPEEQDTNKLGKLWSERRFVEENGWQYYVYYQANTQMRYSRKNPNREGKRGEGQRNSTQNFQGLITNKVDFPGVIKKKTRMQLG